MKKNHIASNIKFIRVSLGLSQNDFAKLFSVSRDNVASYERGSEPRISFLSDIVNYFHVSFEDLIYTEINQTFFETKCVQNVMVSDYNKKPNKNPNLPNVHDLLGLDERNPDNKNAPIPEPTIIYRDNPDKDEIIQLQRRQIQLLEEKLQAGAFENLDDARFGDSATVADPLDPIPKRATKIDV